MNLISRAMVVAVCVFLPGASFADDIVPAAIIRVPESVTTLFVAETSGAEFHRFDRATSGVVRGESVYMSIGQHGDGKQTSGDKRTPLGVYFVTEQLDTSKLHEKYGATAFPLDYPNAWDRRAHRDGDGIWVHGVHPGGGRRPERDTDGCIALPNEDILVLAPEFKHNTTPVIVTNKLGWVDAIENRALGEELESRIDEWVDSRVTGDLYAYFSLYDDDFSRWGMDKTEWSALVFETDSAVVEEAAVSDLLLLAYPGEELLYLSRFRLAAVVDGRETAAMVRLYWRRDVGGALKIIVEDAG